MTSRLSARLARLLNMVPYFIANPGISAPEAASQLGVTTKQLMDDLNQLWMCGLPGYGPGDLIDLSFSEESIEVTFSAGIDRPLRLTSAEAIALVIALRSMLELPGTVDPTAAQSAMAKIEAAAGAAAARFAQTPPAATPAQARPVAESPTAATVRTALAHDRALCIVYYSASRDTVSERTVDPIRIVVVDEHSYLQAWCRAAEGVRLFRFDRIDAATELDEPARAPAAARAATAALDLFHDDESLPVARLSIAPEHAWALDHYPMTPVAVDPDGTVEATMRFGTFEWMVRLLLGFGAGIRVLDPPELAASLRARAAAALTGYGIEPAGTPVR